MGIMAKKFNIVERAPFQPFTCLLCKMHPTHENPALDLDKQIDYFGMVYLCSYCIANVADHMGYMHPKEAAAAREELASLREKIGRIPAVTERLVNDIRDLSIAASADLLAEPAPVVLVNDTEPESSNQGPNLDYFGTSEPAESSSEPVSDEGPTSVSASASSVGKPKTTPRNRTASNG
jgi:hypothetical protein